MTALPVVGTRWRAKPPGREVVVVRRVWHSPDGPLKGWNVRAHPERGGMPVVAEAHWFATEGYEPFPAVNGGESSRRFR